MNVGACVCVFDVHAVDMIIENKWCSIHNTLTQPFQLIRISLCTRSLIQSFIHSLKHSKRYIQRRFRVLRMVGLGWRYIGYAFVTESIENGGKWSSCLITLEQNHFNNFDRFVPNLHILCAYFE